MAVNPTNIFNVTEETFIETALDVFKFQWDNNQVYQKYCRQLGLEKGNITNLQSLPFLPIFFFKTHRVSTFTGGPEIIFTSSGTTGSSTSRHFVQSLADYEKSFIDAFHLFYGDPAQYAFLCLLPSYMEREGSSLIYMAEKLVDLSAIKHSGFFLSFTDNLIGILKERESKKLPSFLLGVTYALLDFAESNALSLANTIVMETGGMKGKRKELTRQEVHSRLSASFGIEKVHSEYGMTELLSQAYSKGDGIFCCPPWMKVLVRQEDDPFVINTSGSGILCIIDLANVNSCSFIETADVGRVFEDGSFEVLGRIDNSDIRGCSLLVT